LLDLTVFVDLTWITSNYCTAPTWVDTQTHNVPNLHCKLSYCTYVSWQSNSQCTKLALQTIVLYLRDLPLKLTLRTKTYTSHDVNVALACVCVTQCIVLLLNTMRGVGVEPVCRVGTQFNLNGRKNPCVSRGDTFNLCAIAPPTFVPLHLQPLCRCTRRQRNTRARGRHVCARQWL